MRSKKGSYWSIKIYHIFITNTSVNALHDALLAKVFLNPNATIFSLSSTIDLLPQQFLFITSQRLTQGDQATSKCVCPRAKELRGESDSVQMVERTLTRKKSRKQYQESTLLLHRFLDDQSTTSIEARLLMGNNTPVMDTRLERLQKMLDETSRVLDDTGREKFWIYLHGTMLWCRQLARRV